MKDVRLIKVPFSDFEWNTGNINKVQKHGVSIPEIESLFNHEILVIPDHDHSLTEERFIGVGETILKVPIFVVFTVRNKDSEVNLRIISARYMHSAERKFYEKLKKNI